MSKHDKDPDSPETTSLAYDAMAPVWAKVQTVLDGTKAMREARQAYLPQHYGETDEAYNERLGRATLFNVTKQTLNSWVGRPFSDPIQFEDVPPKVEALLTDVDMLGNDAQVFCRDWFWDGLAKAYSHCYVDFPQTAPQEGQTRTLAQDRVEGVRPYWVHVQPERLFFASAEVVGGREVLREIRIMEQVTEQVGFAEQVTPQIRRVFKDETGVRVELYRQEDSSKEESPWDVVDEYPISLPFIPLVTFYAHRDDFMLGVPPLSDLADLNIAHWQSTSDQRAILTVSRFPLLALSGARDKGKEIIVGPNRWLYSPDPQGKFYYVEHSGAAIAAGRTDLMDLEEQMSEYGAEFLRKRPGNVTATARALDSAEATSPLQDLTLRFAEAMNLVLEYTANWLKAEDGGKALLSTDFGPEEINQAELTALFNARQNKDISRMAFLKELQRRGLLDEAYDIEEDAEQLELEMMEMFENVAEFGPQPEEDGDGVPEGKQGKGAQKGDQEGEAEEAGEEG